MNKTRPPQSLRRGATLVDILMTISGIVGCIAVTILLKEMTPLPFWACFVIGFPTGLIVGWLGGAAFMMSLGRAMEFFGRRN